MEVVNWGGGPSYRQPKPSLRLRRNSTKDQTLAFSEKDSSIGGGGWWNHKQDWFILEETLVLKMNFFNYN